MHRKILAICTALVALGALAITPAMASATTLKDTVGGVVTTLPVGAKITAYSTGTSFLKGSGLTVECNENILTGSVAKNNGTEAQVTIEDGWFQSKLNASGTKCKSSLGEATITIPGLTNNAGTKHWCIRTVPGTDTWELWGNNCGTEVGSGELTFAIDAGGLTCYFKRTAAVKGTFTTNVGSEHKTAELVMSNDAGKAGVEFVTEAGAGHSVLCPASGLLSEMKFDLFTDPSTSNTYVNPTVAPNPVFITNP